MFINLLSFTFIVKYTLYKHKRTHKIKRKNYLDPILLFQCKKIWRKKLSIMKGIGTKNVSICEDWMIFLNLLNSIILLSNKYNFKRLKWLTCIEVQHHVAKASYYGKP